MSTQVFSINEQDAKSENLLMGAIGAVKDGHCEAFQYKGLYFTNDNGQLSCNPDGPEAKVGAGFLVVRNNAVFEIAEWVEKMVDRYGDSQ